MAYELTVGEFSGPIEKLLSLIEESQLEVTQVSLAQVTDDFLRYLEKLQSEGEQKVSSAIVADFLVVAAKLILIKSKALLPTLPLTEEEETEVHDLELRLKMYREFAGKTKGAEPPTAVMLVARLFKEPALIFTRPLFLELPRIFYPPPGITGATLHDTAGRLVDLLHASRPQAEVIHKTYVSVEEKIKEIILRVEKELSNSFKAISKEKSRSEIVAIFLAMLQLIKRKFINVEQKGQFDDIIISKNDQELEVEQ